MGRGCYPGTQAANRDNTVAGNPEPLPWQAGNRRALRNSDDERARGERSIALGSGDTRPPHHVQVPVRVWCVPPTMLRSLAASWSNTADTGGKIGAWGARCVCCLRDEITSPTGWLLGPAPTVGLAANTGANANRRALALSSPPQDVLSLRRIRVGQRVLGLPKAVQSDASHLPFTTSQASPSVPAWQRSALCLATRKAHFKAALGNAPAVHASSRRLQRYAADDRNVRTAMGETRRTHGRLTRPRSAAAAAGRLIRPPQAPLLLTWADGPKCCFEHGAPTLGYPKGAFFASLEGTSWYTPPCVIVYTL